MQTGIWNNQIQWGIYLQQALSFEHTEVFRTRPSMPHQVNPLSSLGHGPQVLKPIRKMRKHDMYRLNYEKHQHMQSKLAGGKRKSIYSHKSIVKFSSNRKQSLITNQKIHMMNTTRKDVEETHFNSRHPISQERASTLDMSNIVGITQSTFTAAKCKQQYDQTLLN